MVSGMLIRKFAPYGPPSVLHAARGCSSALPIASRTCSALSATRRHAVLVGSSVELQGRSEAVARVATPLAASCSRQCSTSASAPHSSEASEDTPKRPEETRKRECRFKEVFEELARGALISRNDLKVGLESAVPDCDVSDDQVDRMMRIADLDGSGKVDYEEFRVLFEGLEEDTISLRTLAEFWLGYSDAVRDPEMIFQQAWRRLATRAGGEMRIKLPSEIMFLGGAPGAGKGTMTPYIMYERGLTAKPIVISSLLKSPAARKIIDEGGLVGDMEVFNMLLDELSSQEQLEGALVDGFPRTVTQVNLLKILHAKMNEMSRASEGSELQDLFPKPRFRMCILWVDEHTSVERQLMRGRQATEHNKRVAETGEGEPLEIRETDLSVKAARNRYRLFTESTMAANEALNQTFPFNMINASGSIEEVRQVVMQELSYQSSLELQEDTYNAIKAIPTAAELSKGARQRLVARLDSYQKLHPDIFAMVIQAIQDEFLPVIRRHALVGEARICTRHADIFSLPGALDMAVDVMYDRGFCLRAEDRGQAGGGFNFKITYETPHLRVAAASSDIYPGAPGRLGQPETPTLPSPESKGRNSE